MLAWIRWQISILFMCPRLVWSSSVSVWFSDWPAASASTMFLTNSNLRDMQWSSVACSILLTLVVVWPISLSVLMAPWTMADWRCTKGAAHLHTWQRGLCFGKRSTKWRWDRHCGNSMHDCFGFKTLSGRETDVRQWFVYTLATKWNQVPAWWDAFGTMTEDPQLGHILFRIACCSNNQVQHRAVTYNCTTRTIRCNSYIRPRWTGENQSVAVGNLVRNQTRVSKVVITWGIYCSTSNIR